tara:strand:+ start:9416 stop:11113 length:1698 start_codon:yes stop_codon:yes gene_type:complete
MNDIELNKTNKERHYKVNNDIDDVISGGSIEQQLKVTKVSNTGRGSPIHNMQDKIELSSNKDVTIGLDLLVNQDKIVKAEEGEDELDPIDLNKPKNTTHDLKKDGPENIINLNNTAEIDFSNMLKSDDPTNNLVDKLNIDRTSRLSQGEIDAYIDKTDAQNSPNLVDNTELDDSKKYDGEKISRLSDLNKLDNNSINQTYSKDNYQQDKQSYSKEYNHSDRNYYNHQGPSLSERPYIDPIKERKDKEEILWQLEKYRRLGVQGIRKFNMSCDLHDMQAEYSKVKKQRELEGSIKFQRKCLLAFATGTELLNSKLDFLDFKLDGWSEQVHENIDEYNEVFEELHEKYKEKAKMAPELKLMFMMGGSAFMYHITNSMFKNSVPGMEDIMRQNPELMKQFANAAINQMDGEKQSAARFFNNFAPQNNSHQEPPGMGHRPMPDRPSFNNMGGPSPHNRPIPQQSNPPPQYSPAPEPVPSNASKLSDNIVNEVEEITSKRSLSKAPFNNGTRKIPAPVGVDDILNELKSNTVRSNDNTSEVISRTSNRGTNTRNISLKKKPTRSINLNLN